jgi:hypothetical protein
VKVTTNPLVIVICAALAAGMLLLVAWGKITWTQAMAGLGLLLVPSVVHPANGDLPKPPPDAASGPSSTTPPAAGPGAPLRLALAMVFCVSGCALFTSKNANSAMDAVQLACLFESQLTDEKALADACGLASDLIPIIRRLVAQREAAKRAGVAWHGPTTDAGPPK